MTPDQRSPYGPPPAPGYAPGYAPQPYPLPHAPWPNGPKRPAVAIAAGVLGIVTGALTVTACVPFFVAVVGGSGNPLSVLMLVGGALCAIGMITGGVRLLGGHRRGLLLGSAVAAVAVLLLVLFLGFAIYGSEETLGFLVMSIYALPMPVVTAAMTAQRSVKGWTEDPRLS